VGGQWVGETQYKVLQYGTFLPHYVILLAKELDIKLYNQYVKGSTILQMPTKRVVYEGLIPWRLPSSIPLIPAIATLLDVDMIIKRLDSLCKQVPLEDPWNAEKAKEWDSISVDTFQRQTCWTNEAREMIDIGKR
jgi:monoamine oxidase